MKSFSPLWPGSASNRRKGCALVVGFGLAIVLVPAIVSFDATPAHAQQRIGEASNVRNKVVRVSAGRSLDLRAGSSVFRDETVRTGKGASAKLVFLDGTNLAVGPVSSVVLNRFVFAGRGTSQALSVNLARGAFRFTTGVLDKRAYKIRTPMATIGVRGTVLGISAGRTRTRVTLVDDGAALVCARFFRGCIELKNPGDGVQVTRRSIRRITSARHKFSFDSLCAANPGLCSTTQVADASSAAPVEAALCGR